MNGDQQQKIRDGYEAGASLGVIAAAAGVTEQAADIYLTEWCEAGCPGGFPEAGDWGYAQRPALYASLSPARWQDMQEGEDPDDRAVREAHGFGYRVPDYPASAACRNGCGESYGDISAGKMRTCRGPGGG